MTLTKMLRSILYEGMNEEYYIEATKNTFKAWLGSAALYGTSPVIETTRKLLIQLIDEEGTYAEVQADDYGSGGDSG